MFPDVKQKLKRFDYNTEIFIILNLTSFYILSLNVNSPLYSSLILMMITIIIIIMFIYAIIFNSDSGQI